MNEAKWVKNGRSWDLVCEFYDVNGGFNERYYGWVEKKDDQFMAQHPIEPLDENGEFDPEAPDCTIIGMFFDLETAKAAVEKANPPTKFGTYI